MRSVLIFASLLSVAMLRAQYIPSCNLSTETLEQLEAQMIAYQQQLASNPLEVRSEITYIPITFHLIANDRGLGRVKEARVLDQLCQLNKDFQAYNIQFFLRRFNYENSSVLYNDHTEDEALMRDIRDNNAINIFLVQDANNDSTLEDGRTFGYYDTRTDWLVVRRDQINDKSIVLTHEMGHFLGLLHPYNGWDSDPWTAEKHGNPAPVRSPRNIPTELMDGSNCETAGDRLCDTPPDYFFAFSWDNCNYTGGALDPDGVLVDPDELNYMGNYFRCDRESYYFSPEQSNIMQLDVNSPRRNYLRSEATPNVEAPNELVSLKFPEDDGNVPTFNAVSFEWTPVEGATQYLVEIDRVLSFNIQTRHFITTEPSLEINNLDASRQYYWRVRPFNAYNTCSEFSEASTFTTGSTLDTTQLALIEDWRLYPNPVSQSERLILDIDSRRNFDARIRIFDLTGRLIFEEERLIENNQLTLDYNITNLPAGVYAFVINTEEGQLERKFVVTN
ncbi:MAG: T9SS type A sorting domain-containing protein [Bacteroidota bacterium]